jgi:hypothetical protein
VRTRAESQRSTFAHAEVTQMFHDEEDMYNFHILDVLLICLSHWTCVLTFLRVTMRV